MSYTRNKTGQELDNISDLLEGTDSQDDFSGSIGMINVRAKGFFWKP